MLHRGKKLFVGNLSYDASVSEVRSLFEACGEVAGVEIATDDGRPRGYALVTMATSAAARSAIERFDGASFGGRPLHVVEEGDEDTRARRFAGMLRRIRGYVRYARDHERAVAASLFLFDESTGDLRGTLTEWDWTRTSFPSHADEWPTVATALAKRELRVITADEAIGVEQGWFEERGIQGSICVPLCDGEHRLGVIFFDFDSTTGPVGGASLAFLADVGERCARAIGRSH